MGKLNGKKVAAVVTDGFEQIELDSPVERLRNEGAEVSIISPKSGTVRSWRDGDWGTEYNVDRNISEAAVEDYDALLLPGGVINPDKLRRDTATVTFVRKFVDSKKPIAAICHSPWTLIEADAVRGRKLTSFGSIQTDLKNAGANWVDEEVVVDAALVTSRSPEDLPAFNDKFVEEIVEGKHEDRDTVREKQKEYA